MASRLRARTLIGGGLRYEVVDRDSVGLAAGLLPMFEREVLDEALGVVLECACLYLSLARPSAADVARSMFELALAAATT